MAVFRLDVMSQRIGYVNFSEFALWWCKESKQDPARLSDPYFSASLDKLLHAHFNIDWCHGGYMEDRSIIWSDTYLKETGDFLHLGIDCSVGADVEVLAVRDGPIVYVGDDTPFVGGWGGHVVQIIDYNNSPHALVYAHLDGRTCGKIRRAPKGSVIGCIGSKDRNGYWAEHLHLQLWNNIEGVKDWKKFLDDNDGYGKVADRARLAKRCPDPTPLIF